MTTISGAILKSYDLGNFFDTALVCGLGHSEELLGKTLKPVQEKCSMPPNAVGARAKRNWALSPRM